MKVVMLVVVILTFAAAGFWYITENNRADREMAYLRQQEQLEKVEAKERERAELQKAEDERIRKERIAATAKEDAVRMFFTYIDREESRLKDEVEEAEIGLQKIQIDRDALDEELKAIERANAARVSNTSKRGEIHRDKVERVRALLSSVVLNRLAREYGIDGDFSALRSEFEAEVQKIKDVDDKYQKRFRANLKKYDETVKGVDEKVSKKLRSARDKYESVQKQMDPNRLKKLQAQLADVERKIEKIVGKKMQSNWDRRDLKQLQDQQIVLQNQISQYTDVAGLASGNILHMEATEAETEARRKFDQAGKTLTMENDMALLERDYEQDVYNRVKEYEEKSLGKIRTLLAAYFRQGEGRLARAKKHLSYLKQKAVNIDFMNAEEIEAMRKEISKSISRSLIEVEAGK